MSKSVRPRRSVLYMPGANTRALEKARTLPADALIFDLEDAVAPDAKEAARANVVAAAQSKGYGKREIAIRCNGLATPWGAADITAIAKSGADAVVVPKVESAAEVASVIGLLDAAGAPESMAVWAMMETPKGILRAEEVAGSHPRLTLFIMGTNDLVKDMRARHTPMRLPMVTALGLGMLAARAHGLTILDGVYNDIQDAEGFRAVCQQGLEMGFDGKTLIHPSQVEPCNEVFAPSAAELEMAGKIVSAFKAAQAEGKGVVTVDGRMIENLHVDQAERALALAAAIKELQAAP
ncbi:CoA ester lyase [Reyranella sp.]|jgi:citrate lyase subunit beta/citryl-CoA lyase|uniref:HpcH/HpaI aldolase/citrate lyase family protein n=1 Tax=Reyranella sp. TaxID=1929291 RepID=UPI000BD92F17|nr:CoA ester lyase [Reyranella sp.]OYY45257.1 MAG: CoA ester lyase [Rhodospirillales bacterium 35-66-84]OYZ95723.1 MAG: CoA ester lyase [Rhodospirillales bacterium 24-66-33]OZB27241.1 MAG: CoA ester lyase [Rhodospirillales bacterium 39-66-50]HQS18851.1 CoA ester lyase [Reyranella sp.]HQT12764.1 CoA ester lyase [Reyranella sp.]